jgi:hypothetical protein
MQQLYLQYNSKEDLNKFGLSMNVQVAKNQVFVMIKGVEWTTCIKKNWCHFVKF